MINVKKITTGIFILISLFLLIGALIFLGAGNFLATKKRYVTSFSESVQGLSVGTAVKYRGVPIGNVVQILIEPSNQEKDQIVVFFDVDMKSFPTYTAKGTPVGVDDIGNFLTTEAGKGLRARLEFSSFATGMRYIELDYYASPGGVDSSLHDPRLFENEATFLPSSPSTMRDLMNSLTIALERISRIRFEEISDHLSANLKEIHAILGDEQLRNAIANLEEITRNIQHISSTFSESFTPDKIESLMGQLNKNLTELETATAKIGQFAATADRELDQANIPDTTAEFRRTAFQIGEGKEELSNTLIKLNRTLDSLNEFIELLRRDPSSLIVGKHTNEKK